MCGINKVDRVYTDKVEKVIKTHYRKTYQTYQEKDFNLGKFYD